MKFSQYSLRLFVIIFSMMGCTVFGVVSKARAMDCNCEADAKSINDRVKEVRDRIASVNAESSRVLQRCKTVADPVLGMIRSYDMLDLIINSGDYNNIRPFQYWNGRMRDGSRIPNPPSGYLEFLNYWQSDINNRDAVELNELLEAACPDEAAIDQKIQQISGALDTIAGRLDSLRRSTQYVEMELIPSLQALMPPAQVPCNQEEGDCGTNEEFESVTGEDYPVDLEMPTIGSLDAPVCEENSIFDIELGPVDMDQVPGDETLSDSLAPEVQIDFPSEPQTESGEEESAVIFP